MHDRQKYMNYHKLAVEVLVELVHNWLQWNCSLVEEPERKLVMPVSLDKLSVVVVADIVV